MADLVTHVAAGALLKALTRGPHLPTFLVGCVLPDAVSRVPTMGLTMLMHEGAPIPEVLIAGFYVLHMPLGIVPFCWLVASLFPEDVRPYIWGNLVGGSALHLALDVLQSHFGAGYLLLYPFSTWHWEAGLIGPEDSVFAAPVLALLAAALLWLRRGPRKVAPRGE